MYEKQMFEESKINRVKHDTQMYWLSECIPNKESLEKNPFRNEGEHLIFDGIFIKGFFYKGIHSKRILF